MNGFPLCISFTLRKPVKDSKIWPCFHSCFWKHFGSFSIFIGHFNSNDKIFLSYSATNFALLELQYELCNNEIYSTIKKGLNDYISPSLLCPKFAQDITRDDSNPSFEMLI